MIRNAAVAFILSLSVLLGAPSSMAQERRDSLLVLRGIVVRAKIADPDYISIQEAGQGGALSLAELLGFSSLVHFHRSGESGSATASLRGAGSSRTTLTLDGVRLRNPLTGTFDLSLIPGALLEGIRVIHGASGPVGSRALGGSIELETAPAESHPFSISASGGAWGRRSVAATGGAGSGPFSIRVAGQMETYRGDFPFVNRTLIERPALRRSGADRHTRSFVVRSQLGGAGGEFTSMILASHVERGVPGLSNSPGNDARQWDDFLVTQLGYDRRIQSGRVRIQVAHSRTRLRYEHPVLKTTRSNATGWEVVGSATKAIKSWVIESRIDAQLNSAVLEQDLNQSQINGAFSIQFIRKRYELKSGAEYIYLRSGNAISERAQNVISPFFEALLRPFEGRSLGTRVSGGHVFRTPTLSELFWIPGGNPDLKSEKGTSLDATLSFNWTIGKIKGKTRLTGYRNRLRDQIVWRPSFAGVGVQVWRPQNIGLVEGKGLEWTQIIRVMGPFSIQTHASWMRNVDVSDKITRSYNKQLRYTPTRLVRATAILKLGKWTYRVTASQTGSQFLSSDESLAINGWTHFTSSIERHTAAFSFWIAARNLFDARYETIRFQPVPGRHLRLGFSLKERS